MTMLHNPKRMARLRLSIGTRTYDDRPMTPAEVALGIQEFADETGETLESIAKRLQVHTDTCRMFLSILDLPKDWWGIWHFGQTKSSGHLPFSMAHKLGPKFKSGKLTKGDLDLLKGAALDPKKPARRDDITNILSYYSKNPQKTLSECITDIMNLTPEKISSYVIITDIDQKFLKSIAVESARATILKMLGKYFDDSIEDLRITNDSHLLILFNERGHDLFYKLAKKENISTKNLVNYLCMREMPIHG